MQCPCCGSKYQSVGKYVTRILINCGHTLCERCIRALLDTTRKTCPDCGESYKDIDSINSFPKNIALLSMQTKSKEASPPAEDSAECPTGTLKQPPAPTSVVEKSTSHRLTQPESNH